jgi:Flp pilus assembly protein TadD
LDPNFVLAHLDLGMAYTEKSMYKEAIGEMKKALVISPSNGLVLSGLGFGYALASKRAEAQSALDQLKELSKQRYVPAVYTAAVYAGLGEKDNAFEWLKKGYEERSIIRIKVDPTLDPLRSDPRFHDLLRRMNLQP